MSNVKVFCAYDELVDPSQLTKNPKNPNKHPDSQIILLEKAIKELGWRVPITVSNRSGLIIRGHGRLEAAINGNMSEVPVNYQDYDSEEQEIADLLADNKLPELSYIDQDLLKESLDWLGDNNFELDNIGYSFEPEKELEDNIKDLGDLPEPQYNIMIECSSEDEQVELLEKFFEEGLKCKALIL